MKTNITNFLKDNYLEKAENLSKNIEGTNLILNELLSELVISSGKLQKNKKYNKAMEMIRIQQELNELVENNVALISTLGLEKEIIQSTKTRKQNEKDEVDYDEYLVDNTIPHSLDEDFRHTRPYAFEIGKDKILVSTWRELLIKTAEYLNTKNPEIFKSFLTDKSMFWGDKANFVTNEKDVRDGVLIKGSNIYIETSKDSIAAKQLVRKMIEKYNIKEKDYKIYLRANYTLRHEDINVATTK